MGYDKAEDFLGELESLNIITGKREGAKVQRIVIPKKIEEVPVNVMKFLEGCGYTETVISEAMSNKSDETDTQQ